MQNPASSIKDGAKYPASGEIPRFAPLLAILSSSPLRWSPEIEGSKVYLRDSRLFESRINAMTTNPAGK
jgi:hypothetical protein